MFSEVLWQKSYPGAPRGGLSVNFGPFLAINKTGFWALVTKYFKIEKNFRFDLEPTPESLEPKNLIFIV